MIHRLVISLGVTFPDEVSGHVNQPIGQVTISQSRSHVPSSFAPTELVEHADSTMPTNIVCDPSSIDPTHIPASYSQPTIPSDVLSSFIFIPPPSAESNLGTFSSIDPLVALLGQMLVFIEQQARMMAKITQLSDALECHH